METQGSRFQVAHTLEAVAHVVYSLNSLRVRHYSIHRDTQHANGFVSPIRLRLREQGRRGCTHRRLSMVASTTGSPVTDISAGRYGTRQVS